MASEIDSKKFASPATKGEVAGVAIEAAIALRKINEALLALRDGADLLPHIEAIRESATDFRQQFNNLIVEDKK